MARRGSRTSARPLAGLAFVALIIGLFWWSMGRQLPGSGTPQLVVDRNEIDLGTLRYNSLALAVFTLRNAGDGVLKILDEPVVKAVKGC